MAIMMLLLFHVMASNCQQTATEFLAKYNKEARRYRFIGGEANWKYNTNMSAETSANLVETSLQVSKYFAKASDNATKINQTSESADTKRQLYMILSTSMSKNQTIVEKVAKLKASLKGMYSQGCVNATASQVPTINGTWKGSKCLPLDPDLYKILSKSRNATELEFAWKGWRDAVGPKMKAVYTEFVDALNIGARENKWKDYGAYVRSWYEVGDELGTIAEKLWLDLKPFYEELHAYVRFRLRKKYKSLIKDGPIPAHLLGNMWAQSWVNIYDLVVPFPGKQQIKFSIVKSFSFASLEGFSKTLRLDHLASPVDKVSVYLKSLIVRL